MDDSLEHGLIDMAHHPFREGDLVLAPVVAKSGVAFQQTLNVGLVVSLTKARVRVASARKSAYSELVRMRVPDQLLIVEESKLVDNPQWVKQLSKIRSELIENGYALDLVYAAGNQIV